MENDLCENEVTPKDKDDEEGYSLRLSGVEDYKYLVEWKCKETDCSIKITEEDYTIEYQTGDCDDGKDFFITKLYNEETGKKEDTKVWCPVALPFFTFMNIVAVFVIVGLVYFVIEKKKLFN